MSRSLRTLIRLSAATVIASSVITVAGGPGTPDAAASACPQPGDGRIAVGVVIDFDGPGNPGDTITCVVVDAPRGFALGSVVLEARARQLGRPQPRYNPSGLLCAIDGYPPVGCGEGGGGRYDYWSYWFGGSAWSYATIGPATRRMKAGDVDGWRFLIGSTESAGKHPAAPSSFDALFGAAPTTTAPPTPPPSPPAPTTTLPGAAPTSSNAARPTTTAAAATGATGTVGSPGGTPTRPATSTAAAGSGGGDTTVEGDDRARTPEGDPSAGAAAGEEAPPAPAEQDADGAEVRGATTSGPERDPAPLDIPTDDDGDELAAEVASDATTPWGLILGGLLALLLFAGATARARLAALDRGGADGADGTGGMG